MEEVAYTNGNQKINVVVCYSKSEDATNIFD